MFLYDTKVDLVISWGLKLQVVETHELQVLFIHVLDCEQSKLLHAKPAFPP